MPCRPGIPALPAGPGAKRMPGWRAGRGDAGQGSGREEASSAAKPAGGLRWLLQADEIVYLDPRRTRPRGPAVDVDRDPLPDVTLEVTTPRARRPALIDSIVCRGFAGGVCRGL